MVKSTRRELTPDDPVFTRGPQSFVPVSRPLIDDLIESADEESQEAKTIKPGDKPEELQP